MIPYQRHKEGKMKLVESLNKQMANRPGDIPTATLFSLTPPQTPHLSGVANVSQDSSERASLNSKDSAELATDNLLDLSVLANKPQKLGEVTSDSDSLASSSDNELPTTWEKFGDEPPPLPPPRSKLKAPRLIAKQRGSTLIPGSTVDDFSASIAETLYARGKQDAPDSGSSFLNDFEFFKTLGLEKTASDLPNPLVPTTVSCIAPSSNVSMAANPLVLSTPLVPTSVSLVPTPAPLVPTPAPPVPTPALLVPTPAPLVPTPALLVPTPAPLVPTPVPLVPTPAPLVPSTPLVPLVPCPAVPLSMVPPAPLTPSTECHTTTGVITSSNSQNTMSSEFRSRSTSLATNGHPLGPRSSQTPPPNQSSPLRQVSTQRLSSIGTYASKSIDIADLNAVPPSRPPMVSSKSINLCGTSNSVDGAAQVRPRLADPFSDLVKQTMAKTKEGKQLS